MSNALSLKNSKRQAFNISEFQRFQLSTLQLFNLFNISTLKITICSSIRRAPPPGPLGGQPPPWAWSFQGYVLGNLVLTPGFLWRPSARYA